MMPLDLDEIAANLPQQAGLAAARYGGISFTGLSTDTRTITAGQVFVALRGPTFDGHQHIQTAKEKGAVAAIVQREFTAAQPNMADRDFPLFAVDDTLLAYGKFAAAYRAKMPRLTLVGITGSSGKTTIKDYIAAVAGQNFELVKTSGNFNNLIGVPRTLLEIDDTHRVAVVEMGMNQPGEIAQLSLMARPQIAVISNIGHAHIEYLRSLGAIAWEKSRLIAAMAASGSVLVSADDPFAKELSSQTEASVFTAGLRHGHVRAESVKPGTAGVSFRLVAFERERYDISLPVQGKHMVSNALFGFLAGHLLGIAPEVCIRGLEQAEISKSRMELRSAAGLRFIADYYNANPESMVAAIKALADMPISSGGRRVAVLGRLGELGSFSAGAYQTIAKALDESRFDALVTVGKDASALAEFAKDAKSLEVKRCADHAEAANYLREHCKPEDLILIKGSRSAQMENVFLALQISGSSLDTP